MRPNLRTKETEKAKDMKATLKKLLVDGSSVGIHLIFHGKSIEYASDVASKSLKSKVHAGMVGSRASDQKLVNVGRIPGEPNLAHNEHHYFEGRKLDKVRLVSKG